MTCILQCNLKFHKWQTIFSPKIQFSYKISIHCASQKIIIIEWKARWKLIYCNARPLDRIFQAVLIVHVLTAFDFKSTISNVLNNYQLSMRLPKIYFVTIQSWGRRKNIWKFLQQEGNNKRNNHHRHYGWYKL